MHNGRFCEGHEKLQVGIQMCKKHVEEGGQGKGVSDMGIGDSSDEVGALPEVPFERNSACRVLTSVWQLLDPVAELGHGLFIARMYLVQNLSMAHREPDLVNPASQFQHHSSKRAFPDESILWLISRISGAEEDLFSIWSIVVSLLVHLTAPNHPGRSLLQSCLLGSRC